MPHLSRQRLLLSVILAVLGLSPAAARTSSGVHWEKIHVYNAAPTVVFTKLGLTHSTKNGHTRDGKQGVPDPTFPPGLTDVVPNDAEKVLLVRGTTGGLSLFRARVTAADVSSPPQHLYAELRLRSAADSAAEGIVLSTADLPSVLDGVPIQVTLTDGDTVRVYQITERSNPDGTLWVSCRTSLPLPPPPAAALDAPVFIPERVWTDPLSRKVRPGETAQFDDLAAVRHAPADKLGAAGSDTGKDYELRVTLTPAAAP